MNGVSLDVLIDTSKMYRSGHVVLIIWKQTFQLDIIAIELFKIRTNRKLISLMYPSRFLTLQII